MDTVEPSAAPGADVCEAHGERLPAYERIARRLRRALDAGAIPPGTILLEGPLAALFASSRSPVRQALAALAREGRVRRFAGRGVVAGEAEPRRIELDPSMIGLGGDEDARGPREDALYYRFERDLVLQSLAGRFRVNELALARAFEIGRLAAGDLLRRAEAAGIVVRDELRRWRIVPLDVDRLRQIYDLRIALEPLAIRQTGGRIPADLLRVVGMRHRAALGAFPALDIATLDRLERDLHVLLLSFAENREMVEALRRSHPILLVGKHLQVAAGLVPPVDDFIAEHLSVIEALAGNDPAEAARLLANHLTSSRQTAIDRLSQMALDESRDADPDYIVRL
ncbi:GntR family transcriptional regulator [Aureimonas pseudogalii]|uniref:DNA-binding GntR family transcriptional regulator n=1 Tax=Aureimonas pseudogalii TaxID=1744844 RepID=A0A7W6EAV4_9HYPH|nr:GntR family transcriptional regulator [Aureimonas pseudogalii]MBB3997945.1 DNA-binding GntR family transcriptional regulator [Aureimonas pseudogalii]